MRVPQLRQHTTGVWFCRWGGRDHYFSRREAESQRRYALSLQEWAAWRQQRTSTLARLRREPQQVVGLVREFLDYKERTGGLPRRRHYVNHLRRFTNVFGGVRAEDVRASHLLKLREAMASSYAPKTINHDLAAVKSLLWWAASMDYIPEPSLRAVVMVPLPPPLRRALTISQVARMVYGGREPVRAWLAVNYLTLMRPTEVVRVINEEGEWEEPWLFRLSHSKTMGRSQEFRRIVFSAEALRWLRQCRPIWRGESAYYHAAERACGPGGPHPLRHSAATHLAQRGVDRRDIDLLLGHLPSRVSRTYNPVDYRPLRAIVRRLRLPPRP